MKSGRPDGDDLQATIDALSSPVRREILWMLWDAELPAGEIAAGLPVTAGTVSTHLAALQSAGLVSMRAEGNFRHYRIERDGDARPRSRCWPAPTRSGWPPTTSPNAPMRTASMEHWVTVSTEVGLDRDACYDAFTDGATYSAWLGVPVTIEDGRFSAELEWGTRVRGRYEVLARPRADCPALGLRGQRHPGARSPDRRLRALLRPRGRLPGRGAPVRGRCRAGRVPHRGVVDGARQVQGVRRLGPARAAHERPKRRG